jgi:hypothetical protein
MKSRGPVFGAIAGVALIQLELDLSDLEKYNNMDN